MIYKCNVPKQILHSDPYLTPIIHMSPFSGKLDTDFSQFDLTEKEILNLASNVLFGHPQNGVITDNGREAIKLALESIVNKSNFLISILTPSNSGYVSSCVTDEISNHCSYTFGESSNADAYFLIHEFGRPIKPSEHVLRSGKPIIEDCAYFCVTSEFSGGYGNEGHYIVYSLPKAFEMQYGGILFSRDKAILDLHRQSEPHPYLLSRLKHNILKLPQLNARRLDVYKFMQNLALHYGFEEVYRYDGRGIPHAFMVKTNDFIDVAKVKAYMNARGVESSVFYGGQAYFLPCHQGMTKVEVEYIFYHLSHAFRAANF